MVVHEPRRRSSVPLWPYSQVLHTAAVLGPFDDSATHDLNLLRFGLESFRRGDAYSERPTNRRRYYDDNAWVALAALEWLPRSTGTAVAARVLSFLREGARSFGESVGIGWVEGGSTFNACSTGSTGLVAARLIARTSGNDGELRDFASGCLRFVIDNLGNSDGLIADHLRADGTVDPAVYTYNQGLAIGLLAELGHVDKARALAGRTIDTFTGERLWQHAPAFNSILIRELMPLNRLAPDPRWNRYVDDYLDRVWSEARDARGLFTAGGIGRYDSGVVLDHAALVGAFAARARA